MHFLQRFVFINIRKCAGLISALALSCCAIFFPCERATAQAQPPAAADSSTASSGRPRIGLVLSGGGARGVAHIGVLKVLESLHIPIDAIAGTSMGAIVGGLYASGLSVQDIENTITSIDWQDAFQDRPVRSDLAFRRKQDDVNYLVRLPLGMKRGKFLLPKGLIQGQKLNQMVRALTLPVAHLERFDDLPVPFRAVAADLETGQPVILDHGDLPGAMRASMSAPGVFSPVEVAGRLLVDGGLAENLPITVARAMNVDLLIVVDVSFPLLPAKKLESPLQVSNQMLAILVRKETERQRALLGPRDIVIDPALGDTSSVNFTVVADTIAKGEQAARAMQAQLAALSVPEPQFVAYEARRQAIRDKPLPPIEFVDYDERSQRYSRSIDAALRSLLNKPLDVGHLERRIEELYGLDNFETLDYQLVRKPVSGAASTPPASATTTAVPADSPVSVAERSDAKWGLQLRARRKSWGPNYIRFGLNLQDDFEGNNSFNAAARFIVTEINSLGAEWVSDVQVGESPRFFTELYQPLNYGSRFFLAPHLDFNIRSVLVRSGNDSIAEYRVRSAEAGLDFGHEFGNWGELRTGLRRGSGKSRVRIGDPLLPDAEFDSGEFFVRLGYDKLNNINFPRRGQSMTLEWEAARTKLGDERSGDRLEFDWLVARTRGRNTLIAWTTAGTTLDDNAAVEDFFSLGGFLNLSGIAPNSISGPHYGVARLIYYRQIGRQGPGFLDVPTYAGISLEAGNVWQQRRDASFGSALKSGSLFLGLDTLLGPLYLAAGMDDTGETGFYLFLGRTF